MTNLLWTLLGALIGGMIGVIIMTLLQFSHESDKDFDRLPSIWVGFVEGKHNEPLLIRMVKEYGIDVYTMNQMGDYEHVSKLPYSFTSRSKLTEYIKQSGPFLTRSEKNQEDEV